MLRKGKCINTYLNGNHTALHVAIAHNHSMYVSQLIGAGAEVNLRSKTGVSPLCLSLRNRGCRDIIHTLMQAGADVNED